MRRQTIWHEAWLNVATGAARAGALALLLLVGTMGLIVADQATILSISRDAREYRDSGASTWILSAPGFVDPALCGRLASQPGVVAAGALRATKPLHFASAPDQTVPQFEITPGLMAAFTPRSTAHGSLLSADAARVVGAEAGRKVDFLEGSATVADVYPYPDDGRLRQMGYAVLSPVAPVGSFDQCWVEQWPLSEKLPGLLRGVLTPGVPDEVLKSVEMRQLNATKGTRDPSARAFTERSTRWAPLAALVLGVVIAATALMRRRVELAAALHYGVGPHELTRLALGEAMIWATPPMLLCMAVSLACGLRSPAGDAGTVAMMGILIACAGWLGAVLGGGLYASHIRAASLFSYFKER